ncbi:MAG: glycosyltransferase [Alphaproteobacteria bacterium]
MTALALATEREELASSWQGRRVAILIGALAPGSRERVVLDMAERLAEQGAAVDLLIPGASALVERDRSPSISHVDISGRWQRPLPNIARLALSPPRLAAYLRAARPDVALSLSIPPNLALLAARRLAGTGTPVVVRQSNVLRVDGSPVYGAIDRRWRDRLVKRLYPTADAIIAVSNGVADNLHHAVRVEPERIHAIANGILLERIDRLAAAPSPHPWLDDRSRPVVVALGRLVRKKDYPTLLRAFARLRARRPARLIILGEGRKRPAIERLRAELGLDGAVDLPGRVENPFAYLARASLYVLSSTFEGMPSALIEALACGCPAVATDCPSGPSQILDDGRYGRLVPVGDVGALAEAMDAALADPPPRARQNGRAQEFSADRTIDGYLDVLDGVCRACVSSDYSAATARRPLGRGAKPSASR